MQVPPLLRHPSSFFLRPPNRLAPPRRRRSYRRPATDLVNRVRPRADTPRGGTQTTPPARPLRARADHLAQINSYCWRCESFGAMRRCCTRQGRVTGMGMYLSSVLKSLRRQPHPPTRTPMPHHAWQPGPDDLMLYRAIVGDISVPRRMPAAVQKWVDRAAGAWQEIKPYCDQALRRVRS